MKTILMIDDEVEILEVFSIELSDICDEFLIANNAEEACEIIKNHKISLVITDMHFPGSNELFFCTLAQKIPTIAFSGSQTDYSGNAPFKGFIEKPQFHELIQASLKIIGD